MSEHDTLRIESVEDIGAVTPHNQALYEAGKSMLVESINTGREFCKFMTTTAIGAIPTYLALLKLVLPADYVLTSYGEVVFFIPVVLFIISTVLFVTGYLPQRGNLSLDIVNEIEQARRESINRRQTYAIWGFVVFLLAVTGATWICIGALVSGHRTP